MSGRSKTLWEAYFFFFFLPCTAVRVLWQDTQWTGILTNQLAHVTCSQSRLFLNHRDLHCRTLPKWCWLEVGVVLSCIKCCVSTNSINDIFYYVYIEDHSSLWQHAQTKTQADTCLFVQEGLEVLTCTECTWMRVVIFDWLSKVSTNEPAGTVTEPDGASWVNPAVGKRKRKKIAIHTPK